VDEKEKVLSLQAVVYTGPSKLRQAELLHKAGMQKSKSVSQPKEVAEQIRK
jgi:hypothetical protein